MVKINPKDKKYIIEFLPKNLRPNQIDDKIELFRSITGISDLRDILDLNHYTGHHMHTIIDKRIDTVTDINSYDLPIVIARINEDQANRLRRDPNVKLVQEDFEKQKYQGQFVGYQHDHLRSPFAWVAPLNVTGSGVNLCIMDDGMYVNHPDLRANVKVNQDFGQGTNGLPYGSMFHGTHCAGIAAAVNNSIGVVGTAPGANLWNLKIQESATIGFIFTNIVEATQYAIQNGAHILSQSYGGRDPQQTELDVINAANQRGILIVCAAGNTDPLQGGGFTPQLQQAYPAGYGGTLGISNTSEDKILASRSNYGPQVDFCAPGTNINSTASGESYAVLSGTSMACPAVAGVCALAWSAYKANASCPPYTPGETKKDTIVKVLVETASKTGIPDTGDFPGPPGTRDARYGFGFPQADRIVAALKQVSVSSLVAR